MSVFRFPNTPATPERFSVFLSSVQYICTFKWNAVAAAWVLDMADSNGSPVLSGIPLVTGVDLLEPYAYLGIGGQLIVQTDNNPDAVPTFANLGDTGNLYYRVADA